MCWAGLVMADPASTAHAHRTQDHGSECDGDVFSLDIEAQIEYFFFSCAVLVVHTLVRLAAAQHRSPNVRIGFVRSSPPFLCSQHRTPFSRTRAAPMACSHRLNRSHKVSPNLRSPLTQCCNATTKRLLGIRVFANATWWMCVVWVVAFCSSF